MKNRVVYILLGLLWLSSVQAQQGSVQSFTGDMSYLITQYNKLKVSNKNGDEQLPNWVLEPQGNGRYVGVSDPDSYALRASEQVLLRALMLSQLDHQSNIRTHSEVYSYMNDNASTSTSEELSEITSVVSKAVILVAKRTYISKYGEYFVEFYVSDTIKSDPAQFVFNKDDKAEMVLTQYIKSNSANNIFTMKYSVNETLSYSMLLNRFSYDEDNNEINRAMYTYASTIQDSKKSIGEVREIQPIISSKGEILSPSPLNSGYWLSLIRSMLSGASEFSLQINCEDDATTDYGNTSVSSSDKSIVSSMTSNTLKVSLSNVIIRNNEAYIEWNKEIIKAN